MSDLGQGFYPGNAGEGDYKGQYTQSESSHHLTVHEKDVPETAHHKPGMECRFMVTAEKTGEGMHKDGGKLGHYTLKSIKAHEDTAPETTEDRKEDIKEEPESSGKAKGDYPGMIRKAGIPKKYT